MPKIVPTLIAASMLEEPSSGSNTATMSPRRGPLMTTAESSSSDPRNAMQPVLRSLSLNTSLDRMSSFFCSSPWMFSPVPARPVMSWIPALETISAIARHAAEIPENTCSRSALSLVGLRRVSSRMKSASVNARRSFFEYTEMASSTLLTRTGAGAVGMPPFRRIGEPLDRRPVALKLPTVVQFTVVARQHARHATRIDRCMVWKSRK
mmetsp:Transcript_45794/g.108610  ORF Transcript_45794/g.108610 Transcript_45794/m.108610 type:complete len:208 (+) Transcript_45794:869-1492(+)